MPAADPALVIEGSLIPVVGGNGSVQYPKHADKDICRLLCLDDNVRFSPR
jgi:hypothetical protein